MLTRWFKYHFNVDKKSNSVLIGLVLTFLTLWLTTTNIGWFQSVMGRLEYLAYDLRLNSTLTEKKPLQHNIVIVDIDEVSLQKEGRWPWSRKKISQLVENLFEAGAIVVVLDIIFPEPEANLAEVMLGELASNSTVSVKQSIQSVQPRFDYDRMLAESLAMGSSILSVVVHNETGVSHNNPPQSKIKVSHPPKQNMTLPKLDSFTSNIDILQQAASGEGFVTSFRDEDGIVRRSPLVLKYKDKLYPALALEAAREYLFAEEVLVQMVEEGKHLVVDHIELSGTMIPTDGIGQVLVPYRGKKESFPYISATEILSNPKAQSAVENTIVFVGTTAFGLSDLTATPVSNVFPGVEVHANILSGILENTFPVAPSWAKGVNFLVLLGLGVMLSFLLPYLTPIWLLVVCMAIEAIIISSNFYLWVTEGLVLSLASPVLLVLVLMMLNLAYGFLSESRNKRKIKSMFGQYVPAAHIDEMAASPEGEYGFEGDSREMSVLFADIRNFTTISEALSAQELKTMLNEFFTPMTQVIFNQQGTIDKYVGDMIMAFWGAPLKDEAHRTNAVLAAMGMVKSAEVLKPIFQEKGFPEVNIGVGVNTGVMNVGDMGSTFRRSYTVLGDAVNLGSRLEGLTKYYGVSIIIGQETKKALDNVICRPLDKVQVKGKNEPIYIYEPLMTSAEATQDIRDELAALEQAFARYYQKRLPDAQQAFVQLAETYPQVYLYKMFLARIEALLQTELPSNWDGTHVMETK